MQYGQVGIVHVIPVTSYNAKLVPEGSFTLSTEARIGVVVMMILLWGCHWKQHQSKKGSGLQRLYSMALSSFSFIEKNSNTFQLPVSELFNEYHSWNFLHLWHQRLRNSLSNSYTTLNSRHIYLNISSSISSLPLLKCL